MDEKELFLMANLILGELMNEDFLDPCDFIASKEDLINIIEDFWIHSGETGEILKNGWDLDSIVSNNVLLDKIIEINNEEN